MNRLHEHHWTVADYLRLPDDGTRCEILEGDRLMTPSPFPRHQRVSERLGFLLGFFVRSEGRGELFHAPSDVFLSEDTVVQPDLFFVSKARAGIVRDHGIFGAPDLVVEILSESTSERDTVRKRRIYARHGVLEYWIVDPKSDRVEVFVLEGGRLVRKAAHESGGVRSLLVLPGLSVPLAEIFAR